MNSESFVAESWKYFFKCVFKLLDIDIFILMENRVFKPLHPVASVNSYSQYSS